MNRLLCAALALGLSACGGTAISQLSSSTPIGTLSGLVTNTRFEPLENVGVTLILGAGGDESATFKTTTNAQGTFYFPEVPGGSNGQLTIARSGYGIARQAVYIPAQAGNFPLDNGNGSAGITVLTELSGTARFTVYSASGKPAMGAQGLLEVTPSAFITTTSGTYGSQQGVVSVTAVADADGVLTFSGIPTAAEITRVSGGYQLSIGALDEDADGHIDSLGTVQSYSGSTLFTNPVQQIVLSSAHTFAALEVSAANLRSLTTNGGEPYVNALKPNEAITIVFNQAIVQSTRLVKVVKENCSENVAVTVDQRAPNILSISPTTSWTTGAEYHLSIRATGLDTGTTRDIRAYFFALDPSAPRALGTTATFTAVKAPGALTASRFEDGDALYVTFDTPVSPLGGPQARAFINFDLNSSGSVGGMDYGEVGAPFAYGFPVDLAEETYDATSTSPSTFTCRTNSYGSRYRIQYTGLPMTGLSAGTPMRITLPADQSSSTGYQTAWGQPATGDINGSLTVRQ